MKKIIISHPTGNEFSRAAAKGFLDAGMLERFYTSVACMPGNFLNTVSAFKMFADLKRRSFDVSLTKKLKTHPYKELGRMAAGKTGLTQLLKHEKGYFSVDAVYQYLDRFTAKQIRYKTNIQAVYCYEDGAYHTFTEAKKLGLQNVYDLPIGYWRSMQNLVQIEKEINPEWAITINGFKDSPEKLARKDEEIALADMIMVASNFTSNSLQDYTAQLPPVKVIPYGFPSVKKKLYRVIKKNDKIKLLFVGGLSQRKGLSYLFEAVKEFNAQVELTIIGRGEIYGCQPLLKNLAQHSWTESLPHHAILEKMSEHDVLILPSLFEGFGLVISEAMAQGTPVITTERTAGADIIEHKKNGWLVKAGSAESIKKILEEILLQPIMIEESGRSALQTAAERPWHIYGRELAMAVQNL